ncbi:DUF899 domain-containing protein [Nocardiopsis ansamitocini]|uniref:DUF899 domain-containing protein n=1 Tax=Nocardiopsis ansamitocini TaxID=1670832 RepID=A0A9W6P820_9ACTN|nr:DUF899 domain-containing protein [Nocardiopsis ansamitocini]GLU48698.1 hypothetical protein Nans01_30490 [Nocardiopsis ansamitocini]
MTARPKVVSREEWLSSRKELLAAEKELTEARDALSARRRELPMVRIDKDYVFEGPNGAAGLLDLFEGRRQLIVHHLMWIPDRDGACPSCTFHVNDLGDASHLWERDTTLALVSRGPYDRVDSYRRRMGWELPYYSSLGSDFNYDFHVTLDESVAPLLINFRTRAEHEKAVGAWDVWGDELPGVSVFLREDDTVFHTYSTYSRGLDNLLFTLNYLDLTPLGRQT